MNEIQCLVSGQVQGVSFRAFVEDAAKAQSLTGWVKNRTDGQVEIVAQGLTDDLKEFSEALHRGSVLATVDNVATEWGTAETVFEDFVIVYE